MARNVLILEKNCDCTHTYTHMACFNWLTRGAGVPLKCTSLCACVSLKNYLNFFLRKRHFNSYSKLLDEPFSVGLLKGKNGVQNEGTDVVHLNILFYIYCLFIGHHMLCLMQRRGTLIAFYVPLSNFREREVLRKAPSAQVVALLTQMARRWVSDTVSDPGGVLWHSSQPPWCISRLRHVVFGGITWLGISCPLRSPKKNENPLSWDQRVEQFVMHQ